MIATLAPIREPGPESAAGPGRVEQIWATAPATARRLAGETMREVRERMGFLAPVRD
jgi:hypothetical protein